MLPEEAIDSVLVEKLTAALPPKFTFPSGRGPTLKASKNVAMPFGPPIIDKSPLFNELAIKVPALTSVPPL